MKKHLFALTALLSVISIPSYASTLDIDLSTLATSSGGSLSPNIAILSPSVSLGAGSIVVGSPDPSNPTSYSFAAAPTGSLYGGNYLAVLGGGNATVTTAPQTTGFGFTWGTIDTYNTVTLTDAAHNVFSYTGSQLLAAIAGLNPIAGTTQTDVMFTDSLAAITSVVFSSSQNSFEVGNLSEVPVPGSLGLMAAGALALSFAAYRRKSV